MIETPAYFQPFEQHFPVSDDKAIANGFRATLKGRTEFGMADYAELYAFTLYENSQYGQEKWKTYFGPAATLFEGGMVNEEIRLEKITPEVVTYWEHRMTEADHPVLVSRYAGLVWEFSNKVRGEKPTLAVAVLYLENLLAAASANYYGYLMLVFRKLARVLDLSVRLNQYVIRDKAIKAIRELEDQVGELGKPGLWKHSYELLVKKQYSGIRLDLRNEIIGELERRLVDGTSPFRGMPVDLNAAIVAADYLVEYYRKTKSPADIVRVLSVLKIGYDAAEVFANAAMTIYHLEILYERYTQNGLLAEADAALTRIRALGPKLMAEMKVMQIPINISMEIVDQFVEMIYVGDELQAFANLGNGFIQTTEEVKRDGRSIYEMVHKSLYDHYGRKVSTVGAVTSDEYGNTMTLMGRSMTLMSAIIGFILKAGKDKGIITPEALMRVISGCVWFEPVKHMIFERAFRAYCDNDPVIFLHLAVPQVEASCLQLFEQYGGQVWKEGRNGGYHVRLLDDILRDTEFIALVGIDISLYFRSVFTDQRGWNLRNSIAHGLIAAETLTEEKADRVLLVLLLIRFLKLQTL